MQYMTKLSLSICTAFLLSACDPAFQTTAQKCAEGQELEIVIPVPDPKYQVLVADTQTSGGYQLYLKQAIEVMEPETALTDPEEIAAKSFIDTQITDFLSYQKSGTEVTGSANLLDFLENLITTTDPNLVVEAFTIARAQVARGIADDDGFCSYKNDDIRLVDTDANATTLAYAETAISYDPFTRIVQQSVIIAEQRSDLDSTAARQTVPYVGFFQTLPENYTNVGFTEPEVRQAIINDANGFTSLSFDEGKDTKLGQLLFDANTAACDPDAATVANLEPENLAVCDAGIPTRTPSNLAMFDGVCDGDVDKYPDHNFNLSGTYPNARRIRVEVDYLDDPDADNPNDALGQIRIYASNYAEAIESPDGDPIYDPTRCEKQAVLDELASRTPGVAVKLTFIPDPGYDITYQTDVNGDPVLDGDGNQIIDAEPVAAYTYQGTASAIIN